MFKKEGSHGTCVSLAQVIQRDGFQLGRGRAGKGAYFWCQDRRYNKILALGWYKLRRSQRKFEGERNSFPAIIFVELACEDSRLLDMEDYQLKSRLDDLADKLGFNK